VGETRVRLQTIVLIKKYQLNYIEDMCNLLQNIEWNNFDITVNNNENTTLAYHHNDDLPPQRWFTTPTMIYHPNDDLPPQRWFTIPTMIYHPNDDIPYVKVPII